MSGLFLLVLGGDAVSGAGGSVKQTFSSKPDLHPSLLLIDGSSLNPAPDYGWTYDGTSFAPPAAPPAPSVADLIAYAAKKQVTLRDAGIKVNVGTASAPQLVDVASDVNGRSLVSGCVQLVGLAAQNGQPAPSFPWVNNDGSSLTLTAAEISAIGYALGAYVQGTYATLGTVLAAIANSTITSQAGIDTASWPATSA